MGIKIGTMYAQISVFSTQESSLTYVEADTGKWEHLILNRSKIFSMINATAMTQVNLAFVLTKYSS